MPDPRVIFEHGPVPGGTAFRSLRRIIRADDPGEVPAALAALQDAHDNGHWLAGYAGYELGYLFSDKLHDLLPTRRDMPLLLFGVFDAPEPVAAPPQDEERASLGRFRPDWDSDSYGAAFARVQDYIAAGDIYQANLTFPMRTTRSGSIDSLWQRLRDRQAAPHGALVDLGGPVVLSRSPELFFSVDRQGRLAAQPMKGTIARGATPETDTANIRWLHESAKNRAENLMIVDLLRNDMSRIAEIGTVRVPALFTVETYATLHQMTSRITAQLARGITLTQIFEALFPCGSITGAPKIRSMQILAELEPAARDVYCGAIGWIAPDGSMSFSVAIRTLICGPGNLVRVNVGGGVIHDSDAGSEYAEALLKARFADLSGQGETSAPPAG
ncbi:aminodeoxychorismate synthase component I [Pontibaca methylaminivorans]|uniref:Aminodeoxychorismate synthase, subunit I n=1 Tax=Pontibaca methylaminivorans TaxID=515897 RepID=A0A1R3WZX0_9RHOB|nr:aminodeoxychorismate synthase component I [Pontibaca methylaminivorans]SIT83084.1 aminodeoxychorismate synthase, subunit I [Pontibaca methylaminivorans]